MARADLSGKVIDCASKSLYELLNEAADRYPDDIALACLHQDPDHLSSPSNDRQSNTKQPWLRWTHAELAKAGHELARRLRADAIQPGSKVAFIAGSGVEYHIALRACLELRCVFAPMNVNVVERDKEFEHLLSIVDPSVVIAQSAAIATKVDKALSKVPQLRFVLDQAVDGEQGQATWTNLGRYLASETPKSNGVMAEDDSASKRGPDDIILLLSTSGTTSLPKGCPLSNRNLVSAAFGMGEVFEIDKDSVALNHMPLSHGKSSPQARLCEGRDR
jgi:acyl-CoA synthetase (AMP-forming)/AMP-acid ligase II